MDRSYFKEVQIEIVNQKEAEVVGEDNAQRDLVKAMFIPEEVTCYREDPGNEDDPTDRTVIYFKNGYELTAVMNIKEFEELIFNAI